MNRLATIPKSQGDGKALDGAGAELEQDHGGNQCGDIGVHNGQGGPVITGIYGGHGAFTGSQYLLTDSFKNYNVGIHSHTDGQNDTGNARQGQGGAKGRKTAADQDDVNDQGNIGDNEAALLCSK